MSPSLKDRVEAVEMSQDTLLKKVLEALGEFKVIKWLLGLLILPVYVGVVLEIVKIFLSGGHP